MRKVFRNTIWSSTVSPSFIETWKNLKRSPLSFFFPTNSTNLFSHAHLLVWDCRDEFRSADTFTLPQSRRRERLRSVVDENVRASPVPPSPRSPPLPLIDSFFSPHFFFYYDDDDDEEGLGHFTLAAFHNFSPRLPRQPFANFPERPPPSALVHRLLFSPQRMSSAPFSRSRYANFSPKPSSWPFSPFPNTRLLLPPNSFVLIFFARFSVVSNFFFFCIIL